MRMLLCLLLTSSCWAYTIHLHTEYYDYPSSYVSVEARVWLTDEGVVELRDGTLFYPDLWGLFVMEIFRTSRYHDKPVWDIYRHPTYIERYKAYWSKDIEALIAEYMAGAIPED